MECVLTKKFNKPIEWKYDKIPLTYPISIEERNEIVSCYSDYKHKSFQNGSRPVIVSIIENVDKFIFKYTESDYFWYLTLNIIVCDDEFGDCIRKDCLHLVSTYLKLIVCRPLICEYDFDTAINKTSIYNHIGVSILIRDKNDKVILTKRSTRTGISDGYYSTSATGGIELCDVEKENPIIECAVKELKEELNLIVKHSSLKLNCIVLDSKRVQLIAIVDCIIDSEAQSLIDHAKEGKDFEYEVDEIFVADRAFVTGLMNSNTSITNCSRYILSKYVKEI